MPAAVQPAEHLPQIIMETWNNGSPSKEFNPAAQVCSKGCIGFALHMAGGYG